MMFRKILVPTDFSVCSQHAAELAIGLARKCGSEVHFFHRETDPDLHMPVTMANRVADNLKDFIATIDHHGVIVSHSQASGNLVDLILEITSEKKSDLIVMGTHGLQGFSKLFIGSNTQKIVRLSPVPVLAVKNKIEEIRFSNVVFTSNFIGNSRNAYMKFLSFAALFNAKVHLLHVNTLSFLAEPATMVKASMEEFKQLAPEGKCEIHTIVSYNVEEGIEQFIKKTGADLVCVATEGRSGFSRLLRGSIAEEVVNYLDLPVLTVSID